MIWFAILRSTIASWFAGNWRFMAGALIVVVIGAWGYAEGRNRARQTCDAERALAIARAEVEASRRSAAAVSAVASAVRADTIREFKTRELRRDAKVYRQTSDPGRCAVDPEFVFLWNAAATDRRNPGPAAGAR